MQVNDAPHRRTSLPQPRRLLFAALAALVAVPLALLSHTGPAPAAAAPDGRLIWAYYVGYAANSLESLKANIDKIDVLSPHWYAIDGKGNVCPCGEANDKNRAQVVALARAHNVKIVPMVLNNVSFAGFRPVLADPAVRAKAIAAILAEIDTHNWDGIQIDFEGVSPSDRQALTGFMAEIAPQVRQRGKIISQAINAKPSDLTTGYAGAFDYAALAPHADYFTLMTYGYGADVPRSTAPYNWVESSARYAASQIPPSKLLLGIAWYGHAWNLTTGVTVSQTWAQAQARSQASGVAPSWDPVQRSNYFTYTAQGSRYAVWFEDRRSQDERLDLMDRLGLAGAAFWRMGHEDPAVWESIALRFAPTAPPVGGGTLPHYGAGWGAHEVGPVAVAGSIFTANVTVTNTGTATWVAGGATPFRMGYHWYVPNTGTPLQSPGLEIHTDLPGDVPPGGIVTVPLRVQTPAAPGTYTLAIDMVQDGVAWFAQANGAPRSTLDVTVRLTVPPVDAPTLASPDSGTTLGALTGVLRWTNPAGAVQYQVQVFPFNGDGPGINLVRNAESSFTLPAPSLGAGNYILLPGMTYTWRVRATAAQTPVAEDDPAWGPWSEPRAFRTPPATSAGIAPASPAPGQNVRAGATTLRWTDSNSAYFYYEVQVSTDPRFETDPEKATAAVWWNLVHGGQSSPLNSWQTPPLAAGTTYYWRVRPRVQGDGTPVPWSPTWSFRAE